MIVLRNWRNIPKGLWFYAKYKYYKWKLAPRMILKNDPRLKQVSAPVTQFGAPVEEVAKRLMESLYSQKYGNHLGIAAPQIGIMQRIALIGGELCVNPSYQRNAQPRDKIVEACYSCDRHWVVERHPYVKARWQNAQGEWLEKTLRGFAAAVFQHEVDHLDGICCNDIGEEYKGRITNSYKNPMATEEIVQEQVPQQSRLQIALNTPVEELNDEQKALLRENVAALTEAEVARFTEAGILEAPEPPAPTE